MALDTYSNLKTAVATWLARADSGFTGNVDDFIDLTEAALRRPPADPSTPGFGGVRVGITRAAGSLTSGTATLALPSDYLEGYRFILTGSPPYELEAVDPATLRGRFREGSGRPKYYATTDVIELDVAPDANYAYEFSYYPSLTALSSATGGTSNAILASYPDVYLAGCLHYANEFIADREAAATWGQRFKEAVYGANQSYRRGRQSRGPMASRYIGSTP